jgi:hypothetical protein
MAEIKVVNLQVNTNIDNASKDFEDLAKSIKVVDKAATNLDATFEEVYGDLQPLTTRMGEAEDRLYELALAGKQGTQEFKDLLTSVGNYRKTQIQTDMVVDAAATTLGQKLTGSLNAASGAFSLVEGSMALFGKESDDVEKAILKVQSAMAITQGVETITESAKSVRALGTAIKATETFQKLSTAAQWLWNAAMSANPIGVIVASITALLVGGYKLVKFFQDSAESNDKAAAATKRNNDALKQQSQNASQSSTKLKTYNDQQYALAQAAGASSDELRKLSLKHKEEEIALNKKNAVLAQSTFLRERDTLASLKNSGASDEVIANQEKLTQDTYKNFKKQNEILSTSYKERATLRNANAVGEVSDAKAAADKAAEVKKAAQEKAAEKAKEDEKTAKEKAAEKTKQDLKDFNDFQIAINNAKSAQNIADMEEKENKINDLFEIAGVVDELETKNTETTKINTEARKKLTEEEFKAKIAQAQEASNTLSQLSDLVGQQTAAGKALAIASATINTYVGVTQALKQESTLPSPFDVIAKVANVATVLATGFKAVKAITSVQVPGGGGVAGGASPTMGSVSAPVAAAPQFNVVGTSGTNQIAQSLGNQAPVKAYVVANDVTTQQSMDRNIVNTATIGN